MSLAGKASALARTHRSGCDVHMMGVGIMHRMIV